MPYIICLVFYPSKRCSNITDFYSESLLLKTALNKRWGFAFSKDLGFAYRERTVMEILYWFLQSRCWVAVFWSSFCMLLPLSIIILFNPNADFTVIYSNIPKYHP